MGRIFVAAPLTAAARETIAARLSATLAGRPLPGRVVDPRHWHLTLRFLGDISAAQRRDLCRELRLAALGAAFPITFTSLGAFPTPERARVLWLGTGAGAAELAALAAGVEGAAREAGFPPEQRPFRAHLTLARLRPDGDVRALVQRAGRLDVQSTVDQVVVFRSHLGRGGARYEALDVLALPAAGGSGSLPPY